MSEPLLELRCVKAAYGAIEVLHGVDLQVQRGQVFGILGPNGAGKTTLLKVAAALHPASSGDVIVAGRRVNGASPDQLARVGLCLIPEGRGVFPNLTVRENLWMNTYAGTSLTDVEAAAYETFPRLKERRGQTAGTLSGGEQQMLALARAVATHPAVLLLDELSMGLAPQLVEQLYDAVVQIARRGVSILVVEQFAKTVLGAADIAAIMVGGRIVNVGKPEDLEDELQCGLPRRTQELTRSTDERPCRPIQDRGRRDEDQGLVGQPRPPAAAHGRVVDVDRSGPVLRCLPHQPQRHRHHRPGRTSDAGDVRSGGCRRGRRAVPALLAGRVLQAVAGPVPPRSAGQARLRRPSSLAHPA
ncbi:MAG: ABC transporter ATP-binding protein [Ilumatobacteraceae bacterium]